MKEMIGDYDETVLKMLDFIASGERIDFALLKFVSLVERNDAEIDYYVCYAIDWFMVRYNYDRKKATNVLLGNLRYASGYWDDKEVTGLWRQYISRKDGAMK